MSDFKRTIYLNGIAYTCEIVNGEKLIEGKTIEQFYDSLDFSTRLQLALLGTKISIGELDGDVQQKAQAIMNEIYKSKNN